MITGKHRELCDSLKGKKQAAARNQILTAEHSHNWISSMLVEFISRLHEANGKTQKNVYVYTNLQIFHERNKEACN